jgi:LysM repeat protein
MFRSFLSNFVFLSLIAGITGCATIYDSEQKSAVDSVSATPPQGIIYEIKRGDNLPLIAADVTGDVDNWQDIARYNNILNPASIKVGQKLYIPRSLIPAKSGAVEPAISATKKQQHSPVSASITPSTNSAERSIQRRSQRESSSSTYSVRYTCSEISRTTAYSLLASGHSYLDRDGDGHPCEWGKSQSRKTYTTNSNCHYVRGYRRKNGTYVRGHRRCR